VTLSFFTPGRLAGTRILVLGLGRFAGGVEVARFLAAEGAHCTVSDAAPRSALEAAAEEAEALGARLVFGPQTPALLDDCDGIIASPAIPFDHPLLAAAFARGVPITTESCLVLAYAPAPVFGVTGTKGKSTTSTLLAGILAAAGYRTHLGGNIGRPLVAQLTDMQPQDRVVMELSSFQLWWAARAGLAPRIAVMTNLFPDHLDRHGSFAAYAAAKRACFEGQGAEGVAVLPAGDEAVAAAGFLEAGAGRRVLHGAGTAYHLADGALVCEGRVIPSHGLPLRGAHNHRNMLAAAAAARTDPGVVLDAVVDGLRGTTPLPHRLQPIAEIGGVQYVDDSNATNPESTRCALDAFPGPLVLLLGGKDKGIDLTPLLDEVRTRARAVVGIGTTGPTLVAALGDGPATETATDMRTAVAAAARLARPGDVVLLSPASSSLDQYASFAVRGDAFQAAVEQLRTRTP
jgi:UDP-N-acetylmuramoylalanine--D-glutamate ligase